MSFLKICIVFFTVTLFLQSCNLKNSDSLHVEGRFLYSPLGEKIVLRGVNEMFIWSDDVTGEHIFPEIAKTGANTVRIVWVTDQVDPNASPINLDRAIQNCLNENMIPIVELHGATGAWNKLNEQVDYWVSKPVVDVLLKHQKYLLINIANEAGDWSVTPREYSDGYKLAITSIRSKGIQSPLIIDAAGWGQNIDIIQETFKEIQKSDPLKNVVFSVHIWWAREDGSKERIISELEESVKMDIPLIVGEFAPMAVQCKPYIDIDTILRLCQANQIGWLAWSWGYVQNKDCEDMDMTGNEFAGKYEGLEGWGKEVAIEHPFSIKNTSRQISMRDSTSTFFSSILFK